MSMPLKSLKVGLKLGIFDIGGEWQPGDAEERAAWEMYVELVTRISVAELKPGEGLLREAMTSLYSLFGTTRDILRRYGPGIAKGKDHGTISFGYIAVSVLNGALRPLLAKWHPLLGTYEITRPPTMSAAQHEAAWDRAEELRAELNRVRLVLIDYADLLAEAVGTRALLQAVKDTSRP
jgi:hypothetical protein